MADGVDVAERADQLNRHPLKLNLIALWGFAPGTQRSCDQCDGSSYRAANGVLQG